MTAPNPLSIKLMRQVTVKNEYYTKVGNGGYAPIGPQSALHVGQSAVTTGLVYDLVLSHCHVKLNLFVSHGLPLKFRNVEAVVGGKLRIFDLKRSVVV